MSIYPILVVLHAISAVTWLAFVPADFVLKSGIKNSKGKGCERKLISLWLGYGNILGIIGLTGLLVTGIAMVLILPYYSFFQFSGNHWLTTKQIVMILLILIVFARLIPTAKKIRNSISGDLESASPLTEETYKNISKLSGINKLINFLVVLNFLLAITHRFFGK